MKDGFPATIEEKLRLAAHLDERIGRAKAAERQGLVRGGLLGIAMFAILGAWPHAVDPFVFEIFRYGSCGVLAGSEFLLRRLERRRLEVKQRKLLNRPSSGSAS